jgi:hypothetical protein
VPLYVPYSSGEYENPNCATVGELNPYDWHPSTKGEAFSP